MFDFFKNAVVKATKEIKNSCSHYFRNNQVFKIDDDSPSLPPKGTKLFYHHVARILFTNKKSRPDIQACITSLFTRMKSPMDYYKDIYLDIDLLFVNKIQILLMIYWNIRFIYFKTLISKHNKYILDKL